MKKKSGKKGGHRRKRMGRPPKQIARAVFIKLCKIQCNIEEIASFFDCDADTVTSWCKRTFNQTFSVIFDRYRGQGKIALRRKQNQVALAGNVKMLIWLGKQHLNQADKMQHSGEGGAPLRIILDTK